MRIEILIFLNIILTIVCPFIKKKIETPLETELRIIAVDLINNILSMTNKISYYLYCKKLISVDSCFISLIL